MNITDMHKDTLMCDKHNRPLEVPGGLSAHPSNWICPICEDSDEPQPEKDSSETPLAVSLVQLGADAINNRASERDVEQERSMALTVKIFNAISDTHLYESDGWKFMIALKLARSAGGNKNPGDYIDLAGYAGLLGECELNGEN